MKAPRVSSHRISELESIKEKSNMQASIHGKLSDEYASAHTWISSSLLVISTLLVGLTFIPDDFVLNSVGITSYTLKWAVGITSILNFAGVLLLAEWKFQEKAASHREALRFYSGILIKTRKILDSGETITDEIIEEIITDYGKTNALPKIPDYRFLQLKQWHLQKVAISRELSKNPFEPIKNIKKKFQKLN